MLTTHLRNADHQAYRGADARGSSLVDMADMPCTQHRTAWFTVAATSFTRATKHQRPKGHRTG